MDLCKQSIGHLSDAYDEILHAIAVAETINKEDEDTADVAVKEATKAKEKAILHTDAFKQFHLQLRGWLASATPKHDGTISHILPSS